MPFVPHTKHDTEKMLDQIGVKEIDALFDEIPENLRVKGLLPVLPALNEMALSRLMRERAAKDARNLCFIGAGAYEHHIPAAVWDIASRGEFMTAYTPYQAEASQGTLQLLYEYQTMMASLMAMDTSNASLYDGASGLSEAILMAARLQKQKKTHTILLPQTLHPHYRQVVKTIAERADIQFIELPFDQKSGRLDPKYLSELLTNSPEIAANLTAIVVPQPNFFGVLEAVDALTDFAHKNKALLIAVVNPLLTALFKPPGEWGEKGADIACGEGQPLGVPLASGGPYYGFLCCKEQYIRQLPGRIVGRTKDTQGRDGFVLTLQAHEQHIRRARATSNICTNQGLLVTASTIYMSLLGPEGLYRVALTSQQKAKKCAELLAAIPGIKQKFASHHFHEYVLEFDQSLSLSLILKICEEHGIQAGLPIEKYYPELKNCLLICTTETKTDADLTCFIDILKKALKKASANKEPING